jgi:predicted DNA repair protein MutK
MSPWLMKFLSVAGTIAMFLVGGSILAHGLPLLHPYVEAFVAWLAALPGVGGALSVLGPTLFDLAVGVAAGAALVAIAAVARRLVTPRDRVAAR